MGGQLMDCAVPIASLAAGRMTRQFEGDFDLETATRPPGTFPGMDASLRWVGAVAFEADGMGGSAVRFDQPADEGGGGFGFSPIQMQLHALAACMATTVVKILAKQHVQVRGYRIEAHGDRDPEMPHAYTRIVLVHRFTGEGLRRESAGACCDACRREVLLDFSAASEGPDREPSCIDEARRQKRQV